MAIDDVVREKLVDWAKRLLGEPWCKDLIDVEGTDAQLVEKKCEDNIKLLQSGDNLFRLTQTYMRMSKRKKEYKRFSISEWISFAVALAAAGFICYILFSGILTNYHYDQTLFGYPLFVGAAELAVLVCLGGFALPWKGRNERRKEMDLLHAPADLSKAEHDLNRGTRSFIERIVLEESIQLTFIHPSRDTVAIGDGANLSSRAQQSQRIITTYRPAVEIHMLRKLGAAIGIKGERGTGKSELLRSFCGSTSESASLREGGTIGVLVAVPAAFQPIQFLTVVAERLVQAVPGYRTTEQQRAHRRTVAIWGVVVTGILLMVGGIVAVTYHFPKLKVSQHGVGVASIAIGYILVVGTMALVPLFLRLRSGSQTGPFSWALRSSRRRVARKAQRLMRRLNYAETLTSQGEGSIAWGSIGLKRSGQRSISSLPLTEAALLVEIETLADRLAEVGYRVIVGIDEMDKLEAGKATNDFLNSVKQLFAIQSCSFLVSVSESAWAEFVRRNVDIRTALDSSLDAIESTGPLSFLETRSLMRHREKEMTDSQILFCHILSGGLPREALRYARALAKFNSSSRGGGHMLEALAGKVLDREVGDLINTAESRIANNWKPTVIDLNMLAKSWAGHSYCNFVQIARNAGVTYNGEHNRYYGAQKDGASSSRLVLLTGFFHIVREVFCGSSPCMAEKWPNDILNLGDRLAPIRWNIEFTPEDTWSSLEKVAAELKMALVSQGMDVKSEAHASGQQDSQEALIQPEARGSDGLDHSSDA